MKLLRNSEKQMKINDIIKNEKYNEIALVKDTEQKLLSKYRIVIMGIAALWIIFFHTWNPVFNKSSLIGEVERFIKRIGYYGVDIFFFLSGFGLTFSILKSTIKNFYYKRIKRIIIPFLIINIILGVTSNWTIITLLRRIFFIDFYTISIYTTLWFIPAILTLYIIFPIYYKIFLKSSNKIIFSVCTITIITVIMMICSNTIRPDLFGFFKRIPIFITGILYGWTIQNRPIIYKKCIYIILILNFIIGISMAYLINIKEWQILMPTNINFLPNIFIATSMPIILAKVFDMFNNIKVTKNINRFLIKFFSFYGMISLELYSIQEFINKQIWDNIGIENKILTNIIVFFSVTILGVIIFIINKNFWILVENALIKAETIHKYFKKRIKLYSNSRR